MCARINDIWMQVLQIVILVAPTRLHTYAYTPMERSTLYIQVVGSLIFQIGYANTVLAAVTGQRRTRTEPD
jgi:hypothetical protein